MKSGITYDELLAEVGETAAPPDNAMTMAEWADHYGCGPQRMSRLIRLGLGAGKIERVPATRERIDGRRYRLQLFRIKTDEADSVSHLPG